MLAHRGGINEEQTKMRSQTPPSPGGEAAKAVNNDIAIEKRLF